ncbi:MAG: twin-arginine translocase TatA/TatE family subunit [Fibrella sp.]|nr:twin-arginine translocase TatA/TatE family subunit [Armatimonadota bacterium]
MFNLGTTEIVIILVVALLLLGPQQLPEIGKQIGKFLREFRSMTGDVQRALDIDGHHDYDRSHNRGSSFEYGYNDKTGYGVEHDDEPETKAFAYSAPTHGTPIAAIGGTENTVLSNDPMDESDKDTEPVKTTPGARVYNDPVAMETIKVTPSSAVV